MGNLLVVHLSVSTGVPFVFGLVWSSNLMLMGGMVMWCTMSETKMGSIEGD